MGQTKRREASGSNSLAHRKRAWRKRQRRLGDPAYYCVINGRGHWQPNKRLRELGFSNVSCGRDGPEAWATAENMNRLARAKRAVEDAERATADAARIKPCAKYMLLDAWTSVNTTALQTELQTAPRSTAGLQTAPRQPLVRLQTRPSSRLLNWLGAPVRYLSRAIAWIPT
jgi:hypothetical protein